MDIDYNKPTKELLQFLVNKIEEKDKKIEELEKERIFDEIDKNIKATIQMTNKEMILALRNKIEVRREHNNEKYKQAIEENEFDDMYRYDGKIAEDDYILNLLKGDSK